MSCDSDNFTSTSAKSAPQKGGGTVLNQYVDNPLNPTITWGIWGVDNGHLSYTNNNGFQRQVAHVGIPIPENTTDLVNYIITAKQGGYNFFLYQFPTSWIVNIANSTYSNYIIDRINRVKGISGIETHAYIDDIDFPPSPYNSQNVSAFKQLLVSLDGGTLYMGAATNDPLLSFADVILADPYWGTTDYKLNLYSQLNALGKPLEIWISLENFSPDHLYAPDAQTIANELGLTASFTNHIWIFADEGADPSNNIVDFINNGQFNKFMSARLLRWPVNQR